MDGKQGRKRRGRRSRKGGKTYGKESNSFTLPLTTRKIKKSMHEVCPTEVDVELRHVRRWTNAGAASAVTKRFTVNSAWRPDPVSFAFPSTGFTEWQALYSLYRVIIYSYEVAIVNNEAFPVVVYVTNTNADPSTSQAFSEAGNDLSKRRVLAAKGGQDRCFIHGRYNVATVVGSDDVETDDDYRGLMSAGGETSPPDLVWLGVGAQSLSGANITLGVSAEILIRQVTRVYDRQILTQGGSSRSERKKESRDANMKQIMVKQMASGGLIDVLYI